MKFKSNRAFNFINSYFSSDVNKVNMRIFTVQSVKPLSLADSCLHAPKLHSFVSFNFFINNFRRNLSFSFLPKYPKFETAKLSSNIKEHSLKVFKACSKQCEFILAHKIRQSQQMFSLYRKIWGDFKFLFNHPKIQLNHIKNKKLLFSAAVTPVFAWEKQRISEGELIKLEKEIEISKRMFNGETVNESSVLLDSCGCDRCKHLQYNDKWEKFYETSNLIIWRKENEKYKGQELYVYKVYGKFNDVNAYDFFQVQLDLNYRKEWDENSVNLYVVESDQSTSSDILYWEFLFPKMFYNRDYVCNRRYNIDHEKKLMSVVSQSVEHPACPEKPPIHRVKDYWSHIVIKPKEDFDKPGMEFTITYFDNPELSVPSYISLFYTCTGMPQYLMKQKEAALQLAKRRAEYNRLLKEKELRQNLTFSQPQGERILIY